MAEPAVFDFLKARARADRHPRPRAPRVFGVLDLGAAKTAALIVARTPTEREDAWPFKVLGAAVTETRAFKGGGPIDAAAAEAAVRKVMDAAERMAGVTAGDVAATGPFAALTFETETRSADLGGREVEAGDLAALTRAPAVRAPSSGPAPEALTRRLHEEIARLTLDGRSDIVAPVGIYAHRLDVTTARLTLDEAHARTLEGLFDRAHLRLHRLHPAALAAAAACLHPDEADLGAVIADMGAGAVSFAHFEGGACQAAGRVPVGGAHVTNDLAVGLSIPRGEAERMKILHGGASVTGETPGFDMDAPAEGSVRRAAMTTVISARVEETFELLDAALAEARTPAAARVVLTGGASQLPGVAETARRVLRRRVRAGEPRGVPGAPANFRGPAFSALVGAALLEGFAPARSTPAKRERAPIAAPARPAGLRRLMDALFRGL